MGHLSHLEDLLLSADGVRFVQRVLRKLEFILHTGVTQPDTTISVKWDGSPAIVFGPDPFDGRFFVATKSAFSQSPKLVWEPSQAVKLYAPEVASILVTCFNALRETYPTRVLQGDVLYTRPPVIRNLFGTTCYTFTPNTLTYAVPVTSRLGRAINGTLAGVVVHTMFDGTHLRDMVPRPMIPDVFAHLQKPAGLFLQDAAQDISGDAKFTQTEYADFLTLATDYPRVLDSLSGHVFDRMSTDLGVLFLRFVNAQVRGGHFYRASGINVPSFIIWLVTDQTKEVGLRRTANGKQAVARRYSDWIQEIQEHEHDYKQFMTAYQTLVQIKATILSVLERAVDVRTYLDVPGAGMRPTGPEGFVVNIAGQYCKLVNRHEFSFYNFQD